MSKKHKSLAKIAGIAAAVALAIFAAGTLITPVEGSNLWTVIANWTNETLGIGTEGKKLESTEIPEQLVELNELLQQYKLSEAVDLPSYIPKGYRTVSTVVDEREGVIVFMVQLERENDVIVLMFFCGDNSDLSTEVQKNDEQPEIIQLKSGEIVYIVKNMELFNAVWADSGIKYEILNVSSHEELIEMLNSLGRD